MSFLHIILTLYRQYDQYVKLTSWSVDLHEHEELMTFTTLNCVEKMTKTKSKTKNEELGQLLVSIISPLNV